MRNTSWGMAITNITPRNITTLERCKTEYGQEAVNDIKTALSCGYGFASKRRALTVNRSYKTIKNNSLADIHEKLRVTKDDEVFLQKYDLTGGNELLIFFALSDLDWLLDALYVLGDGNHKYNPPPPEFHNPGQPYTLHTIVKGECHPFLYALMKKADQQAYRQLFNTLHDAMMDRFGHTGSLQQCIWLFDFEVAALNACADVFRPLKVQGCAFHYAKAINAKRDELGLRAACKEKDAEGVLTHQANSIKKFFKRVRYLCFLPAHCRLQFANEFLANAPTYPSANINAQIAAFCDYYRSFWLTHPTISNIWGQFGNCGPRTTNYVEGWHNGLHSRMSGRHPSLAEIIELFQGSQHSSKFRSAR